MSRSPTSRLRVRASTTGSAAGPSLRPAAPQTARIEIHSFETVTLTDRQFLTGTKEGNRARIGGELRLP